MKTIAKPPAASADIAQTPTPAVGAEDITPAPQLCPKAQCDADPTEAQLPTVGNAPFAPEAFPGEQKAVAASVSSELAYHFTDSVRLPYIIETGELRPIVNTSDGFPKDFLWATTDQRGDRTSSAMSQQGLGLWRDGLTQLVRLTLHTADFVNFHEIVKSYPEWTNDHLDRLKTAAAAMGQGDTSKWLCRNGPLPLDRVIRAEAKSYAAGRWIEIEMSPGRCIAAPAHPHTRGIVIGEYAYIARRELLTNGNPAFDQIARLPLRQDADS